MAKRFYVTQKQVEFFIKNNENQFTDIKQFKTTVDNTIVEFNLYPEANKNQLKFFKRVQFRLECDIMLQELTTITLQDFTIKLNNLNL